jgi:hypothetical protein
MALLRSACLLKNFLFDHLAELNKEGSVEFGLSNTKCPVVHQIWTDKHYNIKYEFSSNAKFVFIHIWY